MSPDMMVYVAAGLAFVAIAGLGLVFAGGDNTSSKRARAIGAGDNSGGGGRKKSTMLARSAASKLSKC